MPIGRHTFITESAFGLPIYRRPSQVEVYSEIDARRRENPRPRNSLEVVVAVIRE